MPVVSLPDELSQQLNESENGTIYSTQGPGVAVYWSEDGTLRVDIYIGLKLDGFTRYKNISSVKPHIKMLFALKPVILCTNDDVDFDPNKDKLITIKVNSMPIIRCVQSMCIISLKKINTHVEYVVYFRLR